MEECHIEARIGERGVTLAGGHARYLLGFHGADLAGEPVVRLAAPLPAGSVYLDVGANVGVTAIAVALSRPDLRVVAFEPVPSNAECLRRNLSSNGIDNCIMVNAAVGSADGRTTVNDDGPWSRAGLPGPEVPIITLDGWCAEHLGSAAVGLIKIDVEGYEPHVLAGAAETIARWQPPIFMELNPACLLLQGFNPVAFARYLLATFEIGEQPKLDRSSAISLIRDAIVHHGSVVNLTMSPHESAQGYRLEETVAAACGRILTCDVGSLIVAIAAAIAELREASDDAPNQPADQSRITHLEADLRIIRASRSWRLTAPLRAVRARLNRG